MRSAGGSQDPTGAARPPEAAALARIPKGAPLCGGEDECRRTDTVIATSDLSAPRRGGCPIDHAGSRLGGCLTAVESDKRRVAGGFLIVRAHMRTLVPFLLGLGLLLGPRSG